MKQLKTLTLILMASIALSFNSNNEGYQVGDKVEDFKLKNVDEKVVSLSDFKDKKGYIIVVTCNTCPVAKAYEQRIVALNEKYSNTFPVIAINPNDPLVTPGDSFTEMKKRAKDKNYAFPYLIDETQTIAKRFGAKSTPTVFIVVTNENGDHILKYKGAIDNNMDQKMASTKHVETALNEILEGKPVSTPTTKAIGCGIKWRKS